MSDRAPLQRSGTATGHSHSWPTSYFHWTPPVAVHRHRGDRSGGGGGGQVRADVRRQLTPFNTASYPQPDLQLTLPTAGCSGAHYTTRIRTWPRSRTQGHGCVSGRELWLKSGGALAARSNRSLTSPHPVVRHSSVRYRPSQLGYSVRYRLWVTIELASVQYGRHWRTTRDKLGQYTSYTSLDSGRTPAFCIPLPNTGQTLVTSEGFYEPRDTMTCRSDPEVLPDPRQEVCNSGVDSWIPGLGTTVAEGDNSQLHPAALLIVHQWAARVALPTTTPVSVHHVHYYFVINCLSTANFHIRNGSHYNTAMRTSWDNNFPCNAFQMTFSSYK